MVREFYVSLLTMDVNKEDVWDVTVRGVPVRFSLDELATFMQVPRPVDCFPNVKPEVRSTPEEIFRIFQGQDVVVVGSFIR